MDNAVCPYCGEPLVSPDAAAGQTTICPACGGVLPGPADEELLGDAGAPRGSVLVIYALLGLVGFLIASIVVVLSARFVRDSVARRDVPPPPTTLEGWIGQLEQGPDEAARREAAEEITRRGPQSVLAALDATTKIPDDGDTLAISLPVVEAMAAVGPDVVGALGEGLSSEKQNVRAAAARILREIGPQAQAAVVPLAAALADENRWVRWFAADALGNIGPGAAPAVDALLPLIGHEDHYTRRRAIEALGKIGPAAKAAAPLLEKARDKDEYRAIRKAAAVALHQVNLAELTVETAARASEEVQELIQKLLEGDEFESAAAAKALARLGPQAAEAIPALAQVLEHEDKWRRISAAEALGAMGREAGNVAPALENLLDDQDPQVQAAAGQALERIEGKRRGG